MPKTIALRSAMQNLAQRGPIDSEFQSRNKKISAANTEKNDESRRVVKVSHF